MDEQIPIEEVKRLESMVDRERMPNTFNYLLLHGLGSALSPWNLTGGYKTTEDVYAECLKLQCKWEEIIKPPPDDVML